jgi:hypothetical protein
MKHFDLLEQKRKHVKTYGKKIPPKQIIDEALWKAWKTSPSKNNAMAYQALIWGPDKDLHKEAIHSLCVKSHKDAEDRAVEGGLAVITQGGVENPYYAHVKNNPYLITIHSRVSTPNKFYQRQVDEGHFYDQGFESHIEKIIDSVSVEVGIFAANLTNYLLESGVDMSYNSCFRRDVKSWHDVGLKMVKTRPILMISVGYAERYRKEDLIDWKMEKDDIKPNSDDIIKWI